MPPAGNSAGPLFIPTTYVRRNKLTNREIVRFDQLDQTLYTTILDATALRSDARRCARCKGYDHLAPECPLISFSIRVGKNEGNADAGGLETRTLVPRWKGGM